jgi:hypothetical protein
MRLADWLTYTDIEQLQRLNRYYNCKPASFHSKKDLIYALLERIVHPNHVQTMMEQMPEEELRFLQLVILDPSPAYTMEELVARGRAALQGKEGEPRSLIAEAIKKGWLFPGYTQQTRFLYHVPDDTRQQMIAALIAPYQRKGKEEPPSYIRNEENLLVHDLSLFLRFLEREIVRMTQDGAIYRQQQRQILESFAVREQPLTNKGPRFGFGRKYHLYPDRFSLLYDYAFYYQYFFESEEGELRLTEEGKGKIHNQDELQEGKQMYRFWLRLYRRPIPHLPVLVRWIGLLSSNQWFPADTLFPVLQSWIQPFYYETRETLFQKILQLMLHLGVIQIGKENNDLFLRLTASGQNWITGVSAFREKAIEEEYAGKFGSASRSEGE